MFHLLHVQHYTTGIRMSQGVGVGSWERTPKQFSIAGKLINQNLTPAFQINLTRVQGIFHERISTM